MSRKHFEQIAAQFAKTKPNVPRGADADALTLKELQARVERFHQWDIDVVSIADVLSASNPRFDRPRFYRACGV